MRTSTGRSIGTAPHPRQRTLHCVALVRNASHSASARPPAVLLDHGHAQLTTGGVGVDDERGGGKPQRLRLDRAARRPGIERGKPTPPPLRPPDRELLRRNRAPWKIAQSGPDYPIAEFVWFMYSWGGPIWAWLDMAHESAVRRTPDSAFDPANEFCCPPQETDSTRCLPAPEQRCGSSAFASALPQ